MKIRTTSFVQVEWAHLNISIQFTGGAGRDALTDEVLGHGYGL